MRRQLSGCAKAAKAAPRGAGIDDQDRRRHKALRNEFRAGFAVPCLLDCAERVSDFTYVVTWQGFVQVAFVIDAFARRIIGWRASRTAHAGFVLDALEQALHERRPVHGSGIVHHSDRGVQYVSIKYTERSKDAGVEPSVGSVDESYSNAFAETINGLYKAEVMWRPGPWRSFEAVEFAALEWVHWFNNDTINFLMEGWLTHRIVTHENRSEAYEITADLCPICLENLRRAINPANGPRNKAASNEPRQNPPRSQRF